MARIKKLKQKLADGTLSDYINIGADASDIDLANGEKLDVNLNKRPYVYKSVAAMKADTKLKAGDICETLGYYEANDGGQGLYLIKSGNYTDDGGSYHKIKDGIFAELIIKDEINVKNFGAYGDGEHDDFESFKKAIDYIKKSNINTIYIPSGSYLISDTILNEKIDGIEFIGDGSDYLNSGSKIIRTNDISIFNVTGSYTTSTRAHVRHVVFKNLYFGDLNNTFTENSYFNYNYAMYCLMENCTISCYNKSFDFKEFYDSRFINCDFTNGGNQELDIPMITMHGGKKWAENERGWDCTNAITFTNCRFEQYNGTAIKTTTEIQPLNPIETGNYVGLQVNRIYLDNCKFESPFLYSKPTLDFENFSNFFINAGIRAIDGQTEMLSVVNFKNGGNVKGYLGVSYYQTSRNTRPYKDFNNPMMILDGSYGFDLTITPYTSNHYLLNYLINIINPVDLTYRSINIINISSYRYKSLFNTASYSLQPAIQGQVASYGSSGYNGMNLRTSNTSNDVWSAFSKDLSNYHRFYLQYKNGDNTAVDVISALGGADGKVPSMNVGATTNFQKGIRLSKDITSSDSTTRTDRYVGYGSSIPTSGYWIKGDIIFNTNPSSGGNIGWVCITAGSQGTWKTFGIIN